MPYVRKDSAARLRFFLAGVSEISRAAVARARQLMDLRENYRSRLRDKPRAPSLLGVSHPVARQTVMLLQQEGLLTETTGRAWRGVYLDAPILRAIDPSETSGPILPTGQGITS